MKIVTLLPFLLIITIFSFGSISVAHESLSSNGVLSESQLKEIFPDYNFRNAVKERVSPNEITLNNIKSLNGVFDATNEKISDLKGISTLENIDSFIFWNNNIKTIPNEILLLNDLDYINIANNYITTDNILNLLSRKGVKVNYDLNFIDSNKNQYLLETKYKNLSISKNESIDLRKVIEKNIDNYYKYWEVSTEIPKDLDLVVYIEDKNIVSENDMIITGKNEGTTVVKIGLNNKNLNQIANISITVD